MSGFQASKLACGCPLMSCSCDVVVSLACHIGRWQPLLCTRRDHAGLAAARSAGWRTARVTASSSARHFRMANASSCSNVVTYSSYALAIAGSCRVATVCRGTADRQPCQRRSCAITTAARAAGRRRWSSSAKSYGLIMRHVPLDKCHLALPAYRRRIWPHRRSPLRQIASTPAPAVSCSCTASAARPQLAASV